MSTIEVTVKCMKCQAVETMTYDFIDFDAIRLDYDYSTYRFYCDKGPLCPKCVDNDCDCQQCRDREYLNDE